VLAAAVGVFGAVLTPFVYWSVNMWRTLHPKTSVVPSLPRPLMAPFVFSLLALLGLYVLMLAARARLERRRAELDALFLSLEE
jgi:heme exporter protein C